MGGLGLAQAGTAHASVGPLEPRGLATGGVRDGISELSGGARTDGRVRGEVRVFSGDVLVRGPVEGNVRSGFGDLRILAPVDGDIESGFGDVYIDSLVVGEVDVGRGDLVLGPGARVLGHVSVADGRILRAPASVVGGRTVAGTDTAFVHGTSVPLKAGLYRKLLLAAAFVACGLLVFLAVRRRLLEAAATMARWPSRALFFGVAWAALTAAVAAVLAISVIGVPLLALFIPASLALAIFGALTTAYSVGQRVLSALGVLSHAHGAVAMLAGAAMVSMAYIIPVLGNVVLLLSVLKGTGAAVLTVYESESFRIVSRRRAGPR